MSLWLNPGEVQLLGTTLRAVRAVSVDRRSVRTLLDWSDEGPEVVFADAPEQRVDVTIVREADGEGVGFASGAQPGAMGPLSFIASPNASDARRVQVQATVVVLAVEHDLALDKPARQTVRCVALSDDGFTDPISETEADA